MWLACKAEMGNVEKSLKYYMNAIWREFNTLLRLIERASAGNLMRQLVRRLILEPQPESFKNSPVAGEFSQFLIF
jgi:hypothetical protein